MQLSCARLSDLETGALMLNYDDDNDEHDDDLDPTTHGHFLSS